MLSDDYPRVVYYVLLGSVLAFSLFSGRLPLKDAFKHVFAWVGIFAGVLMGYVFWQDHGERLKGALMPYAHSTDEQGQLVFYKDQSGHFQLEIEVNGKPIRFLLDTGATSVSLTRDDAQKLGFDEKNLVFNRLTHTANGVVRSAGVTLEQMQIGSIVIRDVSATVNPHNDGHSLLGMSFLGRLKSYRVEGHKLIIQV